MCKLPKINLTNTSSLVFCRSQSRLKRHFSLPNAFSIMTLPLLSNEFFLISSWVKTTIVPFRDQDKLLKGIGYIGIVPKVNSALRSTLHAYQRNQTLFILNYKRASCMHRGSRANMNLPVSSHMPCNKRE